MYTYPLRALSKDGKEVVSFTLADGPCKLDTDTFILTERPNTPILRTETILRGSDIEGLFEGDILEHKGYLYIIQYHRGLAGLSKEKGLLQLSEFESLKPVSSVYERPEYVIPKKATYTYKYGNLLFPLDDVIGVDNNRLVLQAKSGELADLSKVQQYAGIRYNGSYKYFGDEIEGSPLIMKNGRCCVYKHNTYIDISKGEI